MRVLNPRLRAAHVRLIKFMRKRFAKRQNSGYPIVGRRKTLNLTKNHGCSPSLLCLLSFYAADFTGNVCLFNSPFEPIHLFFRQLVMW